MEKYTQARAVSLSFACLPRAEEVFWYHLYLKPAVYSELIGLSHLVIWDNECVNFARGISSGPQITDQSQRCSLLSRAHVVTTATLWWNFLHHLSHPTSSAPNTSLLLFLAHLFLCLWCCTEGSDSVMAILRAKRTYCFYCQSCMTRLLEDRWGAVRTKSSFRANRVLFAHSFAGREVSVY